MRIRRFTGPLAIVLVPLLAGLAACAGEEGAEMETTTDTAAQEGMAAGEQQQLPDTTVEAVWSYLQAQDYESWAHFPGKGELYEGGEPHGALLTTYVNETAARALEGGSPVSIPEGGIIVKENYTPDSTLAAVTVMYKPGVRFNPDHNNWWFLKRNADGSVAASHRVEGCQNCHGAAQDNDYVLTPVETSGGEMESGGQSGS